MDILFLKTLSLHLFEHQSTFNPNMPMRGLLYFADLYRVLLIDENLYGTKLIKIPTPRYIVFYNGDKEVEDRKILYLSEAFEKKEEHPAIEVEAMMININYGHNKELMEQCEILKGYSILIHKIKTYSKVRALEEAVEQAIRECITEGNLADFLRRRRSEVRDLILPYLESTNQLPPSFYISYQYF